LSLEKYTLSAASLSSFVRSQENLGRPEKGSKIKPGEERIHSHIKFKGVNLKVLDVKISGSETGGGLAVFEQTTL